MDNRSVMKKVFALAHCQLQNYKKLEEKEEQITMDIVEKLRNQALGYGTTLECAAADEIERLRGAILALADTEIREIACVGSHSPVEDALGRLFAMVTPNI